MDGLQLQGATQGPATLGACPGSIETERKCSAF